MHKRVTLITGASSGIGAAIARRIAGPGEFLMLHARGGVDGSKIQLLEDVADETRNAGAVTNTVLSDLSHSGSAGSLVQQTIESFGQLDRIVSNAGYALNKSVGEITSEDLAASYSVITNAFFELITESLPHLIASDCARVVCVSSFVVDQVPGGRLFPATAAAKGAMQALATSFAAQVAGDGVTVNCVAPGFTEKESMGHSAMAKNSWQSAAAMTPNLRLGKPADVAAAVAFFLSTEASHVTGQVLRVDGGLSLI